MGWGTLWQVWDGSGDLWRGPRRVGGKLPKVSDGLGPSGRSGNGLGTLMQVRDRSGIHQEVREGSGDLWEGPKCVRGQSGSWGGIGGHWERPRTGRGTHQEVREGWGTHVDVQDGSGDPGEVRDRSGNPR